MNESIPQLDQKQQPRSDFYTYVLKRTAKPDTPKRLIDENGMVVFYVGKGSKQRIEQHEMCAHKHTSCRHVPCRAIRKEWSQGREIAKEKICENVTEASAFRVERLMIAYGRSCNMPLINLSNGGDTGPTGYKWTSDQIEVRRRIAREQMSDPIQRARIGDMNRGHKMTPEENKAFHQKLSNLYAANPEKGKQFSKKQIEWWENNPQAREAARKRFEDPAVRAKAGEANIGNAYHAKTYKGFQSPMGQIYTNVHHLKKFSEEHGLLSAKMCQVANGERLSHKGWTRYPPLEREQKPTYAKAGFKDPNGVIYEAESIPSLTDFCRQHGLERTCMGQLGIGTLHSHKGWTRYPEIKAERDCHGTYTGPSLMSPAGTVYVTEEIDNLTAFCHKHNLQTSNISLVAQGKQIDHKGWTQYPPLKKSPKFLFKSPDGTVHAAHKLSELCAEFNLNASCMSLLHSGKLRAHKGWTKHNPDDPIQPTLF